MTKKQVIISVVLAIGALVFGTDRAQAQNNTATTQVNIILNDVISIDPESVAIGGAVDFNYNTAADYNSTKTVNVPNSLIVTSTKSFDVNVKAEGPGFDNSPYISNHIPVDVLTIKPVSGGTTTMTGTQNDVVLSTNDQTLISGADLGSGLVLDLNYEIPEDKSSSVILGKHTGTYTQNVTYSVTAL